MPAFLRRLLDRWAKKVDRMAAGSPVPAGVEPPTPGQRPVPTAHERTLMRRRLRALRKRRESLDGAASSLGEPAQELEALDSEARALTQALEERKTLDELVASGVSRRCERCGELVAHREHYCTNCGAQQGHPPAASDAPAAPPRSQQPTAPTAVVTGASSGQSPTPPAR